MQTPSNLFDFLYDFSIHLRLKNVPIFQDFEEKLRYFKKKQK